MADTLLNMAADSTVPVFFLGHTVHVHNTKIIML